ncbi:MAG: hydrogenase iron-sulfur subunit, partial [Deltaproteobacteria bacterium]|nr:hydrogenase iron-sulfur subunit [Deltaproteobacteria bacterium]
EDKVEVFTKATVEKIEGGPGGFEVSISLNGSSEARRCGAIVQATGWNPYDPKKLPQEFGYGQYPNVVTNVEFEEMAHLGQVKRPSDGGPVKTAVFIQCAGSRDPEHLPYCSAVCCQVSMKQAAYLKEQDPESVTYIVYRDVRTPGQFEEFYRKTQEDGVVFIRAENRIVGDGFVEAEDELLGEKVRIEDVDLVVLATGMVPTSAAEVEEAAMEAEAEAEATSDEDAELAEAVADSYGAPNLNLAYRQGGELPLLKHGFPDSNFICFPYESRRSGIYACGPVRRPMGLAASAEDAAGAAMKAIQAVEGAAVGQAPHPRTWDFSYPEFAMDRCTQCKRCTEECPFGAINEDEKANPLPELTRCRRCGICMGACPERIITFKNYSVDMIGSMIKSIDVPEEDEEKPRVLVFVCENDAYPALDMAAFRGRKWSPYVRFIPLRCLGSLNLVWIADALASGIDGILLLGCRHGDDYQCHFVRGSLLAETRMSKIKETLERLVLESERIRVEELSIVDYERVPRIIEEFMEAIDEAGPNPYKGF